MLIIPALQGHRRRIRNTSPVQAKKQVQGSHGLHSVNVSQTRPAGRGLGKSSLFNAVAEEGRGLEFGSPDVT